MRRAPSAARQRAYALGVSAESVAAWLLRLKGYRILARRYPAPVGEIDLIARRGRVLVFVEVKARGSLAAALESLRPAQRARIVRGAEAYLSRHPALAGLDLRFDLVTVAPRRLPRHLPNAFTA